MKTAPADGGFGPGRWILAGMLAGLLAAPRAADAHRVEGCLQATQISISVGRVRLETALTPGLDVAPGILRKADRDGDGRVSEAERDEYAREWMKRASLRVDDRPAGLELESCWFPLREAMEGGLGSIRLAASAKLPPLAPGRHRLEFQNLYETNLSDYLVNALVPTDARVRITGQERDFRQTGIRLDYTIKQQAGIFGRGGANPISFAEPPDKRSRGRRTDDVGFVLLMLAAVPIILGLAARVREIFSLARARFWQKHSSSGPFGRSMDRAQTEAVLGESGDE